MTITEKDDDEIPAKIALYPERVAINAVKDYKFSSTNRAHISTPNLLAEILKEGKAIENGDLKQIERYLYSQAIALHSVFDRMLAQAGDTDFTPHLELFMTLALKAQTQCRKTLATLAQLKSPDQTTFIKQNIQQQNNAVNQQINNNGTEATKKNQNPANELLEAPNEKQLDSREADSPIPINQKVAAMEPVNRPKDCGREEQISR